MQHGIAMFVTDETIGPAELARLVEERPFDSLWVPEHTHIPTSRRSPYAGGKLPEYYKRTLDPFVALTAAAAATERILVGTGVILIVERDPIVTAKEAATLDLVSGGRAVIGVGAGWNLEEMENHGTDPRRRFSLMRERVEAMVAIWTSDEAAYHGRQVDFDPIWQWPKPVQRPHPPIMIGGSGAKVLDRVLAFGDEWGPNVGREERFADRIAELQRRAGEQGRDPIPVSGFGVPHDPAAIEGLREIGVSRCIYWITPAGRDAAEAELDAIAAAIERVGAPG